MLSVKGKLLGLACVGMMLGGCANATNEDIGTVMGAGGGALIGYAISPANAVGPIIGAGAGALMGREVGRRADY